MTQVEAKNTQDLDLTDPRQAKEHKLAQLKEMGINPYPPKFDRTHQAAEIQAQYEKLEDGAETEDVVRVAGRIMANRNNCLLYTSPSPRDGLLSRMPSSA